MMAGRAVVGAHANVDSQIGKIGDAGQIVGGARAVAERHPRGGGRRQRRIAITPLLQIAAGEGQKRRLPDAAGDHQQMFESGGAKSRFPAAPRPLSLSPGDEPGQRAGQFSDDQIDDVDSDRLALCVEHGVVQGQRPGQQRIVPRGQADHEELARQNPPGDSGRVKAQPVGVACQSDIFDQRHLLDGRVIGIASLRPSGSVMPTLRARPRAV